MKRARLRSISLTTAGGASVSACRAAQITIPFGFLSMLIQSLVFAFVYPRLVADPGAISSGLWFATGAALVSWTFTTLAVAAKHRMTSVRRFVAIETAFTAALFLLVGPLFALSFRI